MSLMFLNRSGGDVNSVTLFWTVRTLPRDSPFPYSVVEHFPGCLAPWPGSLAFLEALETTHIFLIKSLPAYTS